jgi:hypothetical protein
MRFIRTFFVAAFLACGVAACSSPYDAPELSNPAQGEKNKTTITVSQTNFSHSVGKTTCPQKIGTVTIKNDRAEPVRWSARRGQGSGQATTLSQTSGKLASGESVTFDVVFNCSQTTDVSEQWLVEVNDNTVTNGPVLNDLAVNITGSVK